MLIKWIKKVDDLVEVEASLQADLVDGNRQTARAKLN